MGRIDIMKGVSGKIGPVVTYTLRNGTRVVRAHVKPNNPQTLKQMANRARFALVNKELSPLSKAIKRGHLSKPNTFSKVIGQACREAVAGDYPDIYLDFSKIQIAAGDHPFLVLAHFRRFRA